VVFGNFLNGFCKISPSSVSEPQTTHPVVIRYRDYTNPALHGFGGLVVSMLASGSRVCGFDPDRSRWTFSDVKKSSACLPSEGK
jgi:hypothetical protein